MLRNSPMFTTTDKGRAICVRPARPTDQCYIARTWAAQTLDVGPMGWNGQARRKVLEANAIVDALLDDNATRILVACEPDNLDRILGFVAFAIVPGARTLLCISVRAQERKKGIASTLVREAGLQQNGTPVSYLWDGPSSKWALAKRPDAIKIEPEDYIAP